MLASSQPKTSIYIDNGSLELLLNWFLGASILKTDQVELLILMDLLVKSSEFAWDGNTTSDFKGKILNLLNKVEDSLDSSEKIQFRSMVNELFSDKDENEQASSSVNYALDLLEELPGIHDEADSLSKEISHIRLLPFGSREGELPIPPEFSDFINGRISSKPSFPQGRKQWRFWNGLLDSKNIDAVICLYRQGKLYHILHIIFGLYRFDFQWERSNLVERTSEEAKLQDVRTYRSSKKYSRLFSLCLQRLPKEYGRKIGPIVELYNPSPLNGVIKEAKGRRRDFNPIDFLKSILEFRESDVGKAIRVIYRLTQTKEVKFSKFLKNMEFPHKKNFSDVLDSAELGISLDINGMSVVREITVLPIDIVNFGVKEYKENRIRNMAALVKSVVKGRDLIRLKREIFKK